MTPLTERLDSFELRLRSMESELLELRSLATVEERVPEPEPLWETIPLEPVPAFTPPPPREPFREPRPPFDLSVLVGARALAWTGGVVTLLGIVFFFVLAVERGWIGEGVRVLLGAIASSLCIAAGVWLRRRFGDTYASMSAAGAGIAGSYATLLAATALYDLVPRPAALAAAAAIAAAGTALAVWWRSQTLASLGLLGANLVPLPIALQDGHLSTIGTAFAAVVFAGTIVVAVPRGWRILLSASFVTTLVEALALVIAHEQGATSVAVAVWLLAAGGGLWLALRERLTYVAASLITFSAAYAGWSAGILYDGRAQGFALLVVAGVFAASSAAIFARERDSASLLWAIALALAAVAAASLTSGAALTIVWSAEAAVLAWLARKIAEPRFQLASIAWLLLAYAHGIGVDARLSKLFVENDSTWRAAISAAALAGGTALAGLCTFEWEQREEGILAPILDGLRAVQPHARRGALALAEAAALYAGSLAIVTVPSSWDWGHVAVIGLWSSVAVALALTRLRTTSIVVAAATTALAGTYDLLTLDETARSWAFASVAAMLIVVAIVHELRSPFAVETVSLGALVLSAGFAVVSIGELLDGRTRGAGLLALAAAYGAIGVATLARRRDFSSALGLVALLIAVPASVILLSDTWLVLAWAAGAAALALLSRFEERLVLGAGGYVALALAHTLVLEAQPNDLFVANRHPGTGAPAILLVLAGAAVIAYAAPLLRRALTWGCGVLGLYALTLGILELFEAAGGGIPNAFQRGHTAVSALWGAVGLALLVAGLRRGGRDLRIAGLALLGASLAKLFVYDLANLSSIARALSFLAVGGVLLVGGFFYQRLAAGPDLHSTA